MEQFHFVTQQSELINEVSGVKGPQKIFPTISRPIYKSYGQQSSFP